MEEPIVPPINAPINARVNAPQKFPRNLILKTKVNIMAAIDALIK